MKNDLNHQIQQAREVKNHKVMPTDILVIPEIVRQNQEKLAQKPRRKRRIDYAKKIMNDSFIMNV
jgi:hypothetical protein